MAFNFGAFAILSFSAVGHSEFDDPLTLVTVPTNSALSLPSMAAMLSLPACTSVGNSSPAFGGSGDTCAAGLLDAAVE
jgi:hypothetical protein